MVCGTLMLNVVDGEKQKQTFCCMLQSLSVKSFGGVLKMRSDIGEKRFQERRTVLMRIMNMNTMTNGNLVIVCPSLYSRHRNVYASKQFIVDFDRFRDNIVLLTCRSHPMKMPDAEPPELATNSAMNSLDISTTVDANATDDSSASESNYCYASVCFSRNKCRLFVLSQLLLLTGSKVGEGSSR